MRRAGVLEDWNHFFPGGPAQERLRARIAIEIQHDVRRGYGGETAPRQSPLSARLPNANPPLLPGGSAVVGVGRGSVALRPPFAAVIPRGGPWCTPQRGAAASTFTATRRPSAADRSIAAMRRCR